ncbi:alpha-glucuronidase family glycosyl hydrolase [Maribacter sp. 4G9]|uniref:alpha-glucuronidase family glycosyl hydrolase n=1 Tax=Maribacter sp. 4G9 TaxID=1889777 RepID=UPI000C152D85|nr:alpha-glucuronidase family glycosyl hydrolase [Maribacter sp. 4G9]PIB27287.1 alpha-glucuronidase [Maribacter sp. 4G9]
MSKKILFTLFVLYSLANVLHAQQGYNLWMDYAGSNSQSRKNLKFLAKSIYMEAGSDILKSVQNEIEIGLSGLLNEKLNFSDTMENDNSLVVSKVSSLKGSWSQSMDVSSERLGNEGFYIRNSDGGILVTANTDIGLLYGVFRLLQTIQSGQDLEGLSLVDAPSVDLRMLNHWDNLDRTVERGYAGFSLWNWQKLPEYIDQRYIDYARANASIGINGTALTNVNANALVLTPMYLEKVAALANVFRKYGIKVYLTARFSAPMEIGELETADPLNAEVRNWWAQKTREIYDYIPDFGGFLVKANSEGQPGPQNYGRTHVDGANMLAEAVQPHGGVVIWRAFVYSEDDETDRAKQAYSEFVPYDGRFMDNVLVQVKNGPIDFQPREPFHPMFGAMPQTPLMMEFQITQEYLGFSSHLVFLPKLFEEVLQSDTYVKGKGSTVAKVVDGSLHRKKLSGMAGVSNIGTDLNWTGHPFAQANWFGFGRLAWNPETRATDIAEEWIKLTYSNNSELVSLLRPMMITSREAVVNYMNPLGLHHLFDTGHHYGPGPWVDNLGRPDWNPTYYHNADENGIGFDRTKTGSNALEQYSKEVSDIFGNLKTCPEAYLLWFHHLPWDYSLNNGNSLWDGLALKYQEGVDEVSEMINTWERARPFITPDQYQEVKMLMDIQLKEAQWWRDASLLYFQTFSGTEIPEGVPRPKKKLEYYKSLKFPFAPGIRPQWD